MPTFEPGPTPATARAPASRAARASNSAQLRRATPCTSAGASGTASATDSQIVA